MRAASTFSVALVVLLSTIATAQSAPPSGNGAMDGMKMEDMPGMAMPAKKPPAKKAKPKKPASAMPQPAQAMPDRAPKPAPEEQAMPAMPQDDKPAAKTDDDMAGMDMSADGADHAMAMHGLLGGYAMSREASGTSWQPESAPHGGIHLAAEDWMVMLHGRVNGIADWQSGPRGAT